MKTFSKYLTEQPQINITHTRKTMDDLHAKYVHLIKDLKSFSTEHGHNIKSVEHPDDGFIYYHEVNGDPVELSHIKSDHTQQFVSKGSGTVDNVHKIMKLYADHHGQISTSLTNTNGSKKLWVDLIKNAGPDYHFTHHYSGHKSRIPKPPFVKKVDVNNLDIDQIWNSSQDAIKHKITMHSGSI